MAGMKHGSGLQFLWVLATVLAGGLGASRVEARTDGQEAEPSRRVDLVICLDTSGSMNGLLDSARQKLWAIVNDLALAKPTPDLRVALLTFGNNGHPEAEGWVKVETPLTEDLDLVSQRLFAQTTNGGTELVARVMQRALDELQFDPSPESLKLMFVAGNESADQDQVLSFRDVCKRAIERGVMVNSIYCGDAADELAPAWREVATRADGHFASIDQNTGMVVLETPFDATLAALGVELNKTYVPWGEAGMAGCENQWRQDANASGLGTAAAAARAATKGGHLYKNSGWDLVDACQLKRVKLEEVKEEDLPEELRAMTVEARKQYLDGKLVEREKLQGEIQALQVKRQAYLEQTMGQNALEDTNAFDAAVRRAVREQAMQKGFRFPAPPPVVPDPGAPAEAGAGAPEAPVTPGTQRSQKQGPGQEGAGP